MNALLLCWLGLVLNAQGVAAAHQEVWRERSTSELVKQLATFDPVAVAAARRLLYYRGDSVRPALVAALDRQDLRTQERLLTLLAPTISAPHLLALVPYANHPHPALRRQAAIAFGRMPFDFPAISLQLLTDTVPSVVAAFLEQINQLPLPQRQRFVDTQLPNLADRCRGPDRRLRDLCLQLLTISDQQQAQELVIDLLPGLVESERIQLLDQLIVRTPKWNPSFATELSRHLSHATNTAMRQRLVHCRLDVDSEQALPGNFEDWLGVVVVATGQKDAEQEAAMAICGLAKQTLAEQLPAMFEQFAASPYRMNFLDLQLQVRGPDFAQDLAEQIATWHPDADVINDLLAQAARLRSDHTAELLLELVPILIPDHQEATVEAVLRMPSSRARTQVLLDAVRSSQDNGRLRAFEGLAQLGDSSYLGFLVDALHACSQPATRSRMTKLLADNFGSSEPDEMFHLLQTLLEGNTLDQRAALTAVPFIGLADRSEAMATYLVDKFQETEPELLLLVLGQIGGDTAEQAFANLDEKYRQGDPDNIRRFLLRHAANLRGEVSRNVLSTALVAEDLDLVTAAYRSLIARRDSMVLERGLEVLARLDSGARSTLIRELKPMRNQPGLADLMQAILRICNDDESRIAVLELVLPSHEEFIWPELQQDLEQEENDALKFAAIEALGRLNTEHSIARLRLLYQPVMGAELEQLKHLPAAAFAVARTAAIGLALTDARAAPKEFVELLYRLEARKIMQAPERWALSDESNYPVSDPLLVQLLASLDPESTLAAWKSAHQELAPLPALLPEEFYLETALNIRRSVTGDHLVADWLELQPGRLWPHASKTDLRALLPKCTPWQNLRNGYWTDLDGDATAAVPQLLRIAEAVNLTPRESAQYFGNAAPFFDRSPERTRHVLGCLLHDDWRDDRDVALRRAADEAGAHGLLLAALAGYAHREGFPQLAQECSRRAVRFAPFLPTALDELAWSQHIAGEWDLRETTLKRLEKVVTAGLATPTTTSLVRQSLYATLAGDETRATELLTNAVHNNADVATRIRRDAAFLELRPLLESIVRLEPTD